MRTRLAVVLGTTLAVGACLSAQGQDAANREPVRFGYFVYSGSGGDAFPSPRYRTLYAALYPEARRDELPLLAPGVAPDTMDEMLEHWDQLKIIERDGDTIRARMPIFTDRDVERLSEWLQQGVDVIVQQTREGLPQIEQAVRQLAPDDDRLYDSLLAVAVVRDVLMGDPVNALLGDGGPDPHVLGDDHYYGWIVSLTQPPQRLVGYRNNYSQQFDCAIHLLNSTDRSHLDSAVRRWGGPTSAAVLKTLAQMEGQTPKDDDMHAFATLGGVPDDQVSDFVEGLVQAKFISRRDDGTCKRLVPVFRPDDLQPTEDVCTAVSARIADGLRDHFQHLQEAARSCSFAHCEAADVSHMVLSYVTCSGLDAIVDGGLLPNYPLAADADWGVWLVRP
jgi:hypothetical protein